jgi:hypothetical protein
MFDYLKSLLSKVVIVSRNSRPTGRYVPTAPSGNNEIDFMLNDPGVPDLVERINIPTLPAICPNFQIIGWQGGGQAFESLAGQAAQVYATLAKTLTFFQKTATTPVSHWAATNQLVVNPRAGQDFNAYYDRAGLHFFYGNDPIRKKVIFTCESVDVVAHELGHALLDCLRPDLWNTQCLEIFAFHEAWGDMIAMLTVMQSDLVLQKALSQVNNDLSKSNCVSRLAEEMGLAIYDVLTATGKHPTIGPASLRDAVNNFHYIPPEQLPANAPDNELAAECHSFGRLFTGAFYDIFVEIYKKELGKNKQPLEAMKSARDICALLLITGIPDAPAVPRFYESVAKAMILADQRMGSQNADILRSVFAKRGILNTTGMSMTKFDELNLKDFSHLEHIDGTKIVKSMISKSIKLSDYIGSMTRNLILDSEIEIPMQSIKYFDKNGDLIDEVLSSEEDAISCAHASIKHLEQFQMIGEKGNFDKHFSVVNGKLVRNFFCGQ